ncbi:MAG: hypothetical protein KIT79_08685 [Deltaproteobacteria bacterium]|nr:hypothetical protein [Deltaproteobacteria bacterium]
MPRKKGRVPLASGDYYTPGDALRARVEFLQAFNRVAPELVVDLRQKVAPVYVRLKCKENPVDPQIIRCLVRTPSTNKCSQDYREFADEFRRWLLRTNIPDDWFLDSVVETLETWTYVAKKNGERMKQVFPAPGPGVNHHKWALENKSLYCFDAVPMWVDLETQHRSKAAKIVWREFRREINLKRSKSRPKSFKDTFMERLSKHLDRLELEYQRQGVLKSPEKNHGFVTEHFEWAVKRIVHRCTLEEIVRVARPKARAMENHTRSVQLAVEQVCQVLGMKLPEPVKKSPRKQP